MRGKHIEYLQAVRLAWVQVCDFKQVTGFPKPQFSHLQNGVSLSRSLTRLLQGSNEMKQMKVLDEPLSTVQTKGSANFWTSYTRERNKLFFKPLLFGVFYYMGPKRILTNLIRLCLSPFIEVLRKM